MILLFKTRTKRHNLKKGHDDEEKIFRKKLISWKNVPIKNTRQKTMSAPKCLNSSYTERGGGRT